MSASVVARFEFRRLEADGRSVLHEERFGIIGRLSVPLVLVREQLIVHWPEFLLIVRASGGVRRGLAVAMLRKREIVVGDIREACVDESFPNIRLGDRRKSSARRALEISELDNFHRGIGLADEIALRRTSCCRVDIDRRWRDCTSLRFASRDIGQYACADNGDYNESYVRPFWPA